MGAPANDCMYCGNPLVGFDDGWAHLVCELVVRADNAACEVTDNGSVTKVERRLRKRGRCPHQIRASGWDGPGTYCGREITDTGGDDPDLFCLEHQCDYYGDDQGAAQERWEHTENLLQRAGLREAI